MSRDSIDIVWDHALGTVQVYLPSGTRINFGRESTGFLWSFLNAAHMPEAKVRLRSPITEQELCAMKGEWAKSGNVSIVALKKAPPGLSLEDLLI